VTGAHWYVLGPGSIGSLFAAGLREAGCPVTLIAREAPSPAVDLTIERDGRTRTLNFPLCDAANTGPIAQVLVTTKSYDVVDAVATIAHRLTPNAVTLILVNGMGFEEALAVNHPGLKPYFGTTTEGAYRIGPRRIRHAGSGRTLVGRSGLSMSPDWFEPWGHATSDCRWEPFIERALWQKLAVNCAINPLTAVYGCVNGELLSRDAPRQRLGQLCGEIAEVTRAEGYVEFAESLEQTVAAVIRGTAANYSSMLQDLRAGRRTEIDYITGYLLRTARRHGIDTPRNHALFQEVAQLDHAR
jgi:2-dehydropantoate 2-reductase